MKLWMYGLWIALSLVFLFLSIDVKLSPKTRKRTKRMRPAFRPLRKVRGLFARTLDAVLELPEEDVDIATAALLCAQEFWQNTRRTRIRIRVYQKILDTMARELQQLIGKRTEDAQHVVSTMVRFVQDLGFGFWPIEEKKHLAFFLNLVLEKKKGGCLGLSLLYLALAERLNIPLFAVPIPGHVFVRYSDGTHEYAIETTTGEITLSGTVMHPAMRYIPPEESEFYLKNLTRKEILGILYDALGMAYLEEEKLELALQSFTKATAINPHDPEAHNNLGIAYTYLHRFKEAIRSYTRAIELNPRFATAYHNRGIVYCEMGAELNAYSDFITASMLMDEEIDPTTIPGL